MEEEEEESKCIVAAMHRRLNRFFAPNRLDGSQKKKKEKKSFTALATQVLIITLITASFSRLRIRGSIRFEKDSDQIRRPKHLEEGILR